MNKILTGLKIEKEETSDEMLGLMKETGINEALIKRAVVLKEGFIVISTDKIVKFLRDLADKKFDNFDYSDYNIEQNRIKVWGEDYNENQCEAIWKEKSLAETQEVPPVHLLKRLKELQDKKIFDYFTVATVEYELTPLKDPFLIGRLNGVKDRYFIGQWGNDINIDNVV